jgi:segregation and condensation protein B
MDRTQLKALLEAIVYVSEDPVTVAGLEKVIKDVPREEIRSALRELAEATQPDDRGVEIRAVAGGYRVYTKPEHHEIVRAFVRSQKPPLRLSRQALETLAVVAYKQPVTQPEIHAIRGVDPSSSLATLLDKGLVVTAGRKHVVGRPILYRTSREFLIRFGLEDLHELPTLKEFEELARASMGEPEPAGSVPEESSSGSSEENQAEPQHDAADAGNA